MIGKLWGSVLNSLTIHNLDDDTIRHLRSRAAAHSSSVEEEARAILRQAVGASRAPRNLGSNIHRRFAAMGGVELMIPPREPAPGALANPSAMRCAETGLTL